MYRVDYDYIGILRNLALCLLPLLNKYFLRLSTLKLLYVY